MKSKKIAKSTTNRYEFNRAYKEYLTHIKNGISCSFCSYHKGENSTGKWYGGHLIETNNNNKVRYPNWKLVSKNSKQWENKPLKITEETKYKRINVEIKF